MNTTVRMKASQLYKDWHVIDAADRPLGRVATEAATLLRGKHKPTFEPHLDDGDFVIVVNASKVRVSGRKEHQIKYYTHSGYPGGLKVRSFAQQLERHPDRVIQQAVWGMLPGGPLGKKMLRHLKVYAGPDHPHASQISQTQKGQAARAEALEAMKSAVPKAPRLRPLSVVAEQPAAVPAEPEPAPPPAAEPPPSRRRGRAPRAAAATTTSVELEASTETVLTDQSPVVAEAPLNEEIVVAENPTPAEAAIEQGEAIEVPRPRRTRKTEAASAEAGTPAKPRARKKVAKTADEEAPAEKPAPRRRTAKKTEE